MATKKEGKEKTFADTSAELLSLLEPFESEERMRLVKGTLTLLGEDPLAVQEDAGPGSSGAGGAGGTANVQAYFDEKEPATKIEELATAARFREQHRSARVHTRADFAEVLGEARRDFDTEHFSRDINNAKRANLFNKSGSAAAGYTLSHQGQKYVDTLPDRETAKASIRRPRKRRAKKKAKKGG